MALVSVSLCENMFILLIIFWMPEPISKSRIWRVLTMVNSTQNYWACGYCPSSGILYSETRTMSKVHKPSNSESQSPWNLVSTTWCLCTSSRLRKKTLRTFFIIVCIKCRRNVFIVHLISDAKGMRLHTAWWLIPLSLLSNCMLNTFLRHLMHTIIKKCCPCRIKG
jgi:hypothetical protein